MSQENESTGMIPAGAGNQLTTAMLGQRQMGLEAIPRIAEAKLEQRINAALKQAQAALSRVNDDLNAAKKDFDKKTAAYDKAIDAEVRAALDTWAPVPTTEAPNEQKQVLVDLHIAKSVVTITVKRAVTYCGDDPLSPEDTDLCESAEIVTTYRRKAPEWVAEYFDLVDKLKEEKEALTSTIARQHQNRTRIPEIRRQSEAAMAEHMLRNLDGGDSLMESLEVHLNQMCKDMEIG